MASESPPKVPPRTHAVHLKNRLNRIEALTVNTSNIEPDSISCRSRRASSVGFVDVGELLSKYQDTYPSRSSSSSRFYTSIRHIFSTSSPNPSASSSSSTSHPVDSHINPMFCSFKNDNTHNHNSISRSLTHLPFPPKKRKSHFRRVFSCFSIFK